MKNMLRVATYLPVSGLLLTLVLPPGATGQVSSFPYSYTFTLGANQNPVTGDGNWSSQASGTGDWQGKTGGGTSGGSAEHGKFKTLGNYARLRVQLNTTGVIFTGGELFEFNMKRAGDGTAAGNAAATITIEYSTDGVNYTAISGPTALSTYLPTTSWTFQSHSLPAGVGGNASVYLAIKIQSGSNSDNHDKLNVDDVSISRGALPIQMASATTAVIRDNDVEVAWRTVSETNNYGFEIQRKRGDTGEWSKIAFVEGHGTTLSPQAYSYVDRGLSFGKYYYRIRQIDLDGTSETFSEMEVNVGLAPDKLVLAQNYPNPFNPSTLIDFAVPMSGHTSVKVYNVLGQEVASLFEGNAEAGRIYTARFDASNLSSGIYFYALTSAGKVETKRMLLLK